MNQLREDHLQSLLAPTDPDPDAGDDSDFDDDDIATPAKDTLCHVDDCITPDPKRLRTARSSTMVDSSISGSPPPDTVLPACVAGPSVVNQEVDDADHGADDDGESSRCTLDDANSCYHLEYGTEDLPKGMCWSNAKRAYIVKLAGSRKRKEFIVKLKSMKDMSYVSARHQAKRLAQYYLDHGKVLKDNGVEAD